MGCKCQAMFWVQPLHGEGQSSITRPRELKGTTEGFFSLRGGDKVSSELLGKKLKKDP